MGLINKSFLKWFYLVSLMCSTDGSVITHLMWSWWTLCNVTWTKTSRWTLCNVTMTNNKQVDIVQCYLDNNKREHFAMLLGQQQAGEHCAMLHGQQQAEHCSMLHEQHQTNRSWTPTFFKSIYIWTINKICDIIISNWACHNGLFVLFLLYIPFPLF